MSALLAANVRYNLCDEAGSPIVEVEGFQVGVFAISHAPVGTLDAWPDEHGWSVDHWPTGTTIAFFREHVDALWFVDELNIALSLVSVEPLSFDELRCAMVMFLEWTQDAMNALNRGEKVLSIARAKLARGKEA